MSDLDGSNIEASILAVSRKVHERLTSAVERARSYDDQQLAVELEDIKLDIANALTAITLEIQLKRLGVQEPLRERTV